MADEVHKKLPLFLSSFTCHKTILTPQIRSTYDRLFEEHAPLETVIKPKLRVGGEPKSGYSVLWRSKYLICCPD